jgi:hypothetical protein
LSAEKELEKWKRKVSSLVNDIRKIEEIHGVRIPVRVIIVRRKGCDSTTLILLSFRNPRLNSLENAPAMDVEPSRLVWGAFPVLEEVRSRFEAWPEFQEIA